MNPDVREDVVEYLLGELPASKAERFEAELLIEPGLCAEVDRLRPVIGRLESQSADAWEPVEPPPLDIAAIVGSTDSGLETAEKKTSAGVAGASAPATSGRESDAGRGNRDRPRRSLAERMGFGWPRVAAVAFSALALFAVGIGVGTQFGGDDAVEPGESAQTVDLQTIGPEVPPGASGEVLLASDTGGTGDRATLDVSGLEPTGEKEFYELWLLGEDGELVALGSFRVEADGQSEIQVPLPVDPERYRYFDVSIQPENGDPQHSGRSVLRGLTSS